MLSFLNTLGEVVLGKTFTICNPNICGRQMAKTDYKVGDMVAFSYWGEGPKIGIVVEETSLAPAPASDISPVYVIMEPGGRKSTVSHKRMELVK